MLYLKRDDMLEPNVHTNGPAGRLGAFTASMSITPLWGFLCAWRLA